MAEEAVESWLRGGGIAGQGGHPCAGTAGQGASVVCMGWLSGAG